MADRGITSTSDYKEPRFVDEGGFGRVYLVRRKSDSKEFILKKVNIGAFKSNRMIELAKQEAVILQKLRHPNIVHVYSSFQENDFFYIVMEYCSGGDLQKAINKRGDGEYFPENVIADWTSQLVLAVTFLHSENVWHRDIKPANIFLSPNQKLVKLADFGIAKIVETTCSNSTSQFGTASYTPPECWDGNGFTAKSDAWATGVVVYYLASLTLPFQSNHYPTLFCQITQKDPAPLPDNCSPHLRDFVGKLLKKDLESRLGFEGALIHPFLLSALANAMARAAVGQFQQQAGSKTYQLSPNTFPAGSETVSTVEETAEIDRIERECNVLIEKGHYDGAAKLADRLIDLSLPKSADSQFKIELSAKMPPRGVSVEAMLLHAGFIYLKAQVYDEDIRSIDYMNKSDLPKIMTAVECFEKVITIFEKLSPSDERLGRSLNRVAFHYSGIAMRNGTERISKQQAETMALKRVEEAIEFFSRFGNQFVMLADCYITRGVCEGTAATQSQLDYYMKGLHLAIKHGGLFHPLLDRAYLNIGIYYEDIGKLALAYNYFRKWHQLLETLYGKSFPHTQRAIRILNETTYRQMAANNGDTVPSPD